jgi:2Fe-2S iron-sulfur cluster binding domain
MGYPPLPTPFPPKRDSGIVLKEGEVAVRFIGTEDGVDRVIAAKPGDAVVATAAKAGVKIATSCRSGLCGTCTTDLEDPNWPSSKTYRPGYQPMRACVAKITVPPGCEEMVLDVYRGSAAGRKLNKNLIPEDLAEGLNLAASELPEAMSRFGENWENDFKPDYKMGGRGSGPPSSSSSNRARSNNKLLQSTFKPSASNDGQRSAGSSRVRRQALDSIMAADRESKRFEPNAEAWDPAAARKFAAPVAAVVPPTPPGNPYKSTATQQEQQVQQQPIFAAAEPAAVQPGRRKLAAIDEDAPRNVGVSRLRANAYQQVALRAPQRRHPRDSAATSETVRREQAAGAAAAAAASTTASTDGAAVGAQAAAAAGAFSGSSGPAWQAATDLAAMSSLYRRLPQQAGYATEQDSPVADASGVLVTDAQTGALLPSNMIIGTAVRQAPKEMGSQQHTCQSCAGGTRLVCYQCEGAGELREEETYNGAAVSRQCFLCMGQGSIRCPDCQGLGVTR